MRAATRYIYSGIFLTSICLASEWDVSPLNSESSNSRLYLESIRFRADIEGDKNWAKTELARFIQKETKSPEKTLALFYLGNLYDHLNQLDSAVVYYEQSVREDGLPKELQTWLYRRMANLKPDLVEPVVFKKSPYYKIGTVYPRKKGHSQDVLYFQTWTKSKGFSTFNVSYTAFKAPGKYEELDVNLKGNEKVYDLCQNFLLAGTGRYLRYASLQDKMDFQIEYTKNIEGAHIISSEENMFLIVYPGQIDVFKENSLLRSISYQGRNCQWHGGIQNSLGILACRESLNYLVDTQTGYISPLPTAEESIEKALLFDDFAILQLSSKLQLWKGSRFNEKKWEVPFSKKSSFYSDGKNLLTSGEEGQIQFRNVKTGKIQWEKVINANNILLEDEEFIVCTPDNRFISFDYKGDAKWYYESDYNQELIPFLSNGYLSLIHRNGQALSLNVDLMGVAYKKNNSMLEDFIQQLENGEPNAGLQFANKVLKMEPGNGLAWKFKYLYLSNQSPHSDLHIQALKKYCQSLLTPAWKNSPQLQQFKNALGANWIWKREPNPSVFPTMAVSDNNLVYMGRDNKSLIFINSQSGKLKHVWESNHSMDSKLFHINNGTLYFSGNERLMALNISQPDSQYFERHPLAPICSHSFIKDQIFISDWEGNLSKFQPNSTEGLLLGWNKKISKNALLLSSVEGQSNLDAVEINGNYYSLSPITGEILFQLKLPEGTITDIHSQKQLVFAGYDNGLLICIDKNIKKVLWTRNFSDQIFSLSGNQKDLLVLTTSGKKIVCVNALNGGFLNESPLSLPLLNKPTVQEDSYWIATVEPSLEWRNFNHEQLASFKLPDLPGNPLISSKNVMVSTQDGFILAFSPPKR